MQVDVNANNFNPLYYHICAFYESDAKYCLLRGGAGSGKTHSILQKILIDAVFKGKSTIVFRKTSAKMESTIIAAFELVIKQFKAKQFFRVKQKPYTYTCLHNGAVIAFSGLADSEDIKGLVGYTTVYMNELTLFDKQDWNQMRIRLRGMTGLKLIADFNPIDENHWVKKTIYDIHENIEVENTIKNGIKRAYTTIQSKFTSSNGQYFFLNSNLLNNFWIVGSPCQRFGMRDEQYLKDFEDYRVSDPYYYNVYFMNQWGKTLSGMEFYKCFRPDKHTFENTPEYTPTLPLHLSFDENVKPYITCVAFQMQGKRVNIIKEFCLRNPKNDIFSLCNAVAVYFADHRDKVFVYGDATSKKRSTLLEQGRNWFDIIVGELGSNFTGVSMRVPSSNPSVSKRGLFVNKILGGEYNGISISINSTLCPNTVQDFMYQQEDHEGNKLKTKIRDPETKEVYEKYGHTSDCVDYLLCEAFSSDYENMANGGGFSEPRAVFNDNAYDFENSI